MFRLDGKIAAVTGAGSGIGRAIANTFANAGARVFVLERDTGAGEETAADIRAKGGMSTAIDATWPWRAQFGRRSTESTVKPPSRHPGQQCRHRAYRNR